MIGLLEQFARPLLRLLDAEDAHRLAILALKIPPFVRLVADDPRLAVRAFGLNFPNPVGMAAGFDKHAEVPDALLRLGFGFVEVGTVTPLPQVGNPRPRVFRLTADEGVINRLGFNSEGADAVLRRLAARAQRGRHRRRQYRRQQGQRRPHRRLCAADRDVRAGGELFHRQHLVAQHAGPARPAAGKGVRRADRAGGRRARPRQPAGRTDAGADQDRARSHAQRARRHRRRRARAPGRRHDRRQYHDRRGRPGCAIRRPRKQAGGLSGRPLFALATRMLAETYVRVEGAFPLVGVGGIDSGEAALAKIRAGACLIQLYSALVFQGCGWSASIKVRPVQCAAPRRARRHRRPGRRRRRGHDGGDMAGVKWPT